MSPTLRSSETSIAARSRRTSAERLAAQRDAEESQDRAERTKKGCWTCRIRRKKCDEEQVDGRCSTCRRLELECMGWGTKRPDWLKDRKAVDIKRAEIKVQLQSQNMIRGQIKNDSGSSPVNRNQHHRASAHTRTPSSPYLSVPDYRSRVRKATAPAASATIHDASTLSSSSSTSSRGSVSASSRPQRAAKTQANRNLHLYNNGTNDASGSDLSRPASPLRANDDADLQDASGEEDYSTSPNISHDNDSEMSPRNLEDRLPGLHSTSFPELLLGGYPEEYNNASFLLQSMGDETAQHLAMESVFRSDMPFEAHAQGYSDPFDNIGLSMHHHHQDQQASTNAYDYNFDSSTLSKELPAALGMSGAMGMSMSYSVPMARQSMPSLDTNMAISSGELSSTGPITSPGLTSASSSGTGVVGVTVTSPTGITMPAGGGIDHFGTTSYFPQPVQQHQQHQRQHSSSPSNRTMSPPVASLVPASAQSSRSASTLTPQQHSRGHYPQPPPAQRRRTSPGYIATTAQAEQQPQAVVPFVAPVRSPLADPTKSLSSHQETLIFYYFNRGVRRMQYLLADDLTTGVTDVMYDLVIRDPLGPVTNAICSLASLHDTRLRIAHGLIHPEDPTAHDNAQKHYSDTVIQLAAKAGAFTDVEAIASLHLLSFWLFCGGGGDWASALGLAGDWLDASQLMRDESRDPMDILADWKPAMRFAAQSTLWFDILGACSLKQRPRFYKLYQRIKQANRAALESSQRHQHQSLFSGGASSTITGRKPGAPPSLMDSVMGCDDDIMFALASIAELADWKEKQLMCRRLSMNELVERGRAIEKELTATKVVSPVVTTNSSRGTSPATASSVLSPMSPLATFGPGGITTVPGVWDAFNASTMISVAPPAAAPADAIDPTWGNMGLQHSSVSLTSPPPPQATSSTASSPSQAGTGVHGNLSVITTTAAPITLRQLCSNVFREAAFLFLYTVVNGCEPAVTEISDSVANLVSAICAIRTTDLDRSLAFPITLGGCLTDKPEEREFFGERLAAQGSAVGNGSQAKMLMETVWKRRDAGEKGVCWRETMKEMGFDLLLV
ncbi:hypothetical protein FRB94_000233 [Tulasnella sp. JGI-2019a]|nr:hypothetical protein FRB94_000233 [Tulasnella sp. JGI-2019a]